MANKAGASGTLAPAEVYAPPQRRHGSRIPTLVWLLLLVVAVVCGVYVGRDVLKTPVNFGDLGGQTTIGEDDLDRVVATYVLDGEVFEITARDAIAQSSSLDAIRNADGSYAAPSVESVIAAARAAVVMREVEARNITVSDEEIAAYAMQTFGTDDFGELATAFTMDDQTVRDRLRESASMAKLRSQVVTVDTVPPEEPLGPEDGNLEAASEDYANYILALAGDEWDSEHGIWTEDGGPFATALKDYDVRADSATYGAAMTAYNVAYQLYSANTVTANTQWTEYVNGLLAQASLATSSLVS